MRSHPLFRDVLRQYAMCKRPILGAIPPLEASEEVPKLVTKLNSRQYWGFRLL